MLHKYQIGEKVVIYASGKLVERTIRSIQMTITESQTVVGYLFKEDRSFFGHHTSESEVFESIDHFINLTTGSVQKRICRLPIEPDYSRPYKATIKFLPQFRVHLTGTEIKEGKLTELIKAQLPIVDDNETLNLHCLSYTVIKSHIVPDEIPLSNSLSS